MGRSVLGIGQHNSAVTTHEHALDGAHEVILGALVTGQIKLGRSGYVTGQLGLGIVLIQVSRDLIVSGLEHGNGIGRLVGLYHKLSGSGIDEFTPLAVNGLGGVLAQGLEALGLNAQGVGAGIQVLKHEHTVVVLVGGVACHFLTVLVQDDNSAVDGIPLVHRRCIVIVQVVNQVLVNILHGTHDITLVVGGETEVLTDTASDADTLLMAIVDIQRTVACGLIGVEITLNQEARCTMFQHAQITGVSNTGIRVDTSR